MRKYERPWRVARKGFPIEAQRAGACISRRLARCGDWPKPKASCSAPRRERHAPNLPCPKMRRRNLRRFPSTDNDDAEHNQRQNSRNHTNDRCVHSVASSFLEGAHVEHRHLHNLLPAVQQGSRYRSNFFFRRFRAQIAGQRTPPLSPLLQSGQALGNAEDRRTQQDDENTGKDKQHQGKQDLDFGFSRSLLRAQPPAGAYLFSKAA